MAEDGAWHVKHFCCFSCDQELGGHRYMFKENQPYCLECYKTKFARVSFCMDFLSICNFFFCSKMLYLRF